MIVEAFPAALSSPTNKGDVGSEASPDNRIRTTTMSGIVLRQRPLGERDRIVTLYTRERGKLAAVAKGARQPRSKLAAMSQPLTHGRYTVARGKSLGVLTQGTLEDPFFRLKQDLLRMAFATCAVELLDKTVPEEDAAADIFNLLLASLYEFQIDPVPELVLRSFELELLHLLGYLPTLKRCSRCNSPLADLHRHAGSYLFSPQFGGIVCRDCQRHTRCSVTVTAQTIEIMVALRSCDPMAVRRLTITPRNMQEMRRALSEFIQYRLDVNLKSTQFLDRLRWMRSHPVPPVE